MRVPIAHIYGFKEQAGGSGGIEERIANLLVQIDKSIGGDSETSMATQIAKMRNDFRDFTQTMAKENKNELIKALQDVVTTFNEKLIESFGESFRQLNEGVKELVVWQKQYKDHVETMTAQFQRTLASVETCERQIADITTKAAQFSTIAEKMEILLRNLNTTFVGIDQMAAKIPNVFPQIETTMDNMTRRFAAIIDDTFTKNENMLTIFYRQAMQSQSQQIEDLSNHVKHLMTKIQEETTTTFASFNEQVGKALKLAIESLGSQLTSLSAKFVDDYRILADALSNLHNTTTNKLKAQ